MRIIIYVVGAVVAAWVIGLGTQRLIELFARSKSSNQGDEQ